MRLVEFNKASLKRSIEEGGIVLVDCWASWCRACRDFAPVFKRVAERFPEYTFGKLNTAVESELTEILEIAHIPSILLYRGGFLLFRQPGYLDEKELLNIVEQAESLDMDRVRAEMDQKSEGERDSETD